MKIRHLPNVITTLRIIGSAVLLFLPAMEPTFLIIYTVCGFSDVLDGMIARAAHVTSDLGARLDSIADMLFYAVMLLKIFPVLSLHLPPWIWLWVSGILLLRVGTYLIAAFRFHHFSSLHTYLNKLTGLSIFAVPYLLNQKALTAFCIGVCVIASLATVEELIMHLFHREYCEGKKTLLQCFFNRT